MRSNEELKVLFKELLERNGVWDRFWKNTTDSIFLPTPRTALELNNNIVSRNSMRSIIQNAFPWNFKDEENWSVINGEWLNIFDEWDKKRRKEASVTGLGNEIRISMAQNLRISDCITTTNNVDGTTWIYDG